jgi:hypothetical protein
MFADSNLYLAVANVSNSQTIINLLLHPIRAGFRSLGSGVNIPLIERVCASGTSNDLSPLLALALQSSHSRHHPPPIGSAAVDHSTKQQLAKPKTPESPQPSRQTPPESVRAPFAYTEPSTALACPAANSAGQG